MEARDLCIDANESLLGALKKLDLHAQGAVFVIENGKFLGVLTDGDVRRAFIAGASKTDSVRQYCNADSVTLKIGTAAEVIQRHLNTKIRLIPLLDDDNFVRDFASVFRLHRIPVLEPLLGGNELEYVTDCIKTNWISSQGRYVNRFEEALEDFCTSGHCVSTSSGTTALHLGLLTLGIGPGDEVIVPDLTFGASVNAIIHCGATPVLVDVEPDTWNLSVERIAAAIGPKTRAIMPVHLYGNPAPMQEITDLSSKHGIFVIEDCAEALGSSIDGRPVGTFGHAAAFSFFGNKVITCGEGGALLVRDHALREKAAVLRDHGMEKGNRYWHINVGYNYRLTNVQAAIGCAQFEQFKRFRERRKRIFEIYDELLLSPKSIFRKQHIAKGNEGSFWLYTVLIDRGLNLSVARLTEKLLSLGIETRPIFYPMHEMPAFRDAIKSEPLINSVDISRRGISLPTSVSLSDDEVIHIGKTILNLVNQRQLMNDI